jgi:outer membrane receptor protein involved in Fe transport
MNLRFTHIFLIYFLVSSTLFAETPIDKGWLKGKIKDATNSQPVEYATIAIYTVTDNTLIDGAVSGIDGDFKIQKLQPGNYYLIISFIGYDDKKVEKIIIKKSEEKVDIGEIKLERTVQNIDEIEVVGNKNSVKYEIDKKVINVSQQQTSASGTAVDILEKIPSVRVDIDGNVSLRGSTGFTVLIDGKPTILEPSEALQQIPATTIDNIEVITNPSAKYDPDGVAGIINIITKKQKLQGVSALANVNYGIDDKYGADILVNIKKGKFNYYVGADYNHRYHPGSSEMHRETYINDTTYRIESNGTRSRSFSRKSVRAGIDYSLSEKDNLALNFRLGRFEMESKSDLDYFEQISPLNSETYYTSVENSIRGGDFLSSTIDYNHNFKKKGHKIFTSINYRERKMDEENTNILYDLDNTEIEGRKTTEIGPSKVWRIKADYTLPITKTNKFEAGLQFRMGKSTDNTDLSDLVVNSNNQFLIVPEYTNGIDYQREIYSVYSLYAGKYAGLGYQFGLRGEYTYRNIYSKNTNENFNIDRLDYFPTIHFSYSLPGENQFIASYSKRIERTRGWFLEPFLTWEDAYNVRQGNPGLLPEFIDSYEVGYIKNFNDNTFSVESYYRITNNKVERVQSVYDDEIMLRTFANIGKDYALGTEVMLNYSVAKYWNFNLMGDLYQYRVKGELDNTTFDNESFNWRVNFDNTFKLPKNIKLQISNRYNSPTVTSQGEFEGFYTLNMAIKKDFFDRKLSANLQVRDVLATSAHEFTSEGNNFYVYNYFDRDAPMVMLTLSYRFNNYRPSKKMMNGGDSESDDF